MLKQQIQLKRIYAPAAETDGIRILVDRLWPRGISKAKANVTHWLKDIAPTTELRTWFSHLPERWSEFQKRYRTELAQHQQELEQILTLAQTQQVTLLYGARDQEHNQAQVLLEVLQEQTQTD